MRERESICVRIQGGLGNQMFQYAAGLALARRLDAALLLHPVDSRPEHARFALQAFAPDPPLWTPDPARRSFADRLRGRSGAKKAERLWPGPVFRQPHFCAADGMETIAPGTYVIGYFQSEACFAGAEAAVRAAFALDRFLDGVDPALIAAASAPGAASVHIRRGDYAADPKTRATHGLLADEHYARARALLEELAPVERWLVFSDDPAAAAALTEGWPGRTVVSGATGLQDMALMARCAHHVIANSSFSWWGAWLGRNPARRVVAPRRWFAPAEMRRVGYVDGVCPVGWVLV